MTSNCNIDIPISMKKLDFKDKISATCKKTNNLKTFVLIFVLTFVQQLIKLLFKHLKMLLNFINI